MRRRITKQIAWGLILAGLLVASSAVVAGGQSQAVARRAMCEAHLADCEAAFGPSDRCQAAYDHCIDKGAFPMPDVLPDIVPDIVPDPVGEDRCEKAMRECRDPDWDPSPTHDDDTPVVGD